MVDAKKSFGQHFLRDATVVAAILRAAEPEKFSLIVEVGPGNGVLTRAIVRESQFALIEADRDLIPALEQEFPSAKVIFADAARVDYADICRQLSRGQLSAPTVRWLLVGNLPYNAANAIIMNALESECPPERMVVMVQKEVGERMLGLTPQSRGVLTVAVQMYADVERICTVKPGAFVPPPKVDSMVLRLTKGRRTAFTPDRVIALAKIGFANRRKQLHRNLADAGVAPSDVVKKHLVDIGLTASARAEELSMEQWVHLCSVLPKPEPRVVLSTTREGK